MPKASCESTPEMAGRIYEGMSRTLARVRRRLARPLTLADKVLLGHLDDPEGQPLEPGRSTLRLRPDRVVFQDVLGQTAMLQFMQTGLARVAVPTTIHCDHLIRAARGRSQDLQSAVEENQEVYDFLRSAAARYGAGFWEPGAGIIHQVVLENYAFPGQLILGTDSHTPNAGGLGACAVGVGGADAVEAIAGLPWELLYPRRIAVHLSGALNGWASPKDVILFVAGRLSTTGATQAILEYIGPGARTLSATGKATIANMGAELGATTSIFPADERMERYLVATGRGDLARLAHEHRDLLAPDPEAEARPAEHYDRVVEVDLSALEPHLAGPHSPDRVRPLSELAAEVAGRRDDLVDTISVALIGSCTNSSYEDLSRAADVAAQAAAHGLTASARLLITPGSERVRATAARDGLMQPLERIGGTVLASACGPCIGQWERTTAAPNTIVSSYNRNFRGRNDGQPATMNFLASPELVTALALAGRLSFNPVTDSLVGADGRAFRLAPPRPAPDVPPEGFTSDGSAYVAPPEDGRAVATTLDPRSERLQMLGRWPAWDGHDLLDLPILVKARGKTTTDQISPAGPWLRYRGHLEKFSENMFSGAVNAFTEEVGRGTDALTGAMGQPLSAIARHYRAEGLRWVVVGDHNYGEGSSREHAALSPRLLGAAAVIARSFARIHESNLKKQGLLALRFREAADYERIREGDRISLLGLADLAAGRPVECRVRHADGTGESLVLEHSYTSSQLEWFRAGSALNVATGASL
jgi:aconitate hydratase A / 2-methylisocitrate dehydratase